MNRTRALPILQQNRKRREPGEPATLTASTRMRYDVFIASYVALGGGYGNGKQAAIDAGYSARTASQMANKILKVPYVHEQIKLKQAENLQTFELTAHDVMRQLAAIVKFDIRKLYNADGTLKNVVELDDDTASALASIESLDEFDGAGKDRKKIGETKKVRTVNKIDGIRAAMQHFKLLGGDGVNITAGKVVISRADADLC